MRRTILVLTVLTVFGTMFGFQMTKPHPVATGTSLPEYTPDQIKSYDGTDPGKPIYLAMDGLVYDVTAGREFYQSGGPYHYLAGKDSSADLHLAGGSIIKRKYKVIGKLKL